MSQKKTREVKKFQDSMYTQSLNGETMQVTLAMKTNTQLGQEKVHLLWFSPTLPLKVNIKVISTQSCFMFRFAHFIFYSFDSTQGICNGFNLAILRCLEFAWYPLYLLAWLRPISIFMASINEGMIVIEKYGLENDY